MQKKTLLVFLLSLFLLSCAKVAYNYRTYPPGTILKGQLAEGGVLYLIRDNDAPEMEGRAFVHTDKAVVDVIAFGLDPAGNLTFRTDDLTFAGKVKMDKTALGMHLTLPAMPALGVGKQVVHLVYWDVVEGRMHCRDERQVQTYDSVVTMKDVRYGTAPGFYTSQPIDSIGPGDTDAFRRLIFEDIRKSVSRRDSLPLRMDVYRPYDPEGEPKPAFLFIHGGGFFLGDKENKLQRTLTDDLVRRGCVVVSMNYRLGSTIFGVKSVEKMIYSGVQDARAALRYLTHHSEELGIDPDLIYVGGSSAGAIISLNTAFMDNDEIFRSAERRRVRAELGNINTSGNELTDRYSIAGVVSMWGAVVDLSIVDGRNADVPVLFFHGTADNIVPVDSGLPFQETLHLKPYERLAERWQLYGSRSIYQHMKERSMPARLFLFDGYSHEPQRNKDGSYNGNIDTIREQLGRFVFQEADDAQKAYAITGDAELTPSTGTALYEIADVGNAKIQWSIEGGLFVDRTGNTVSVVWYDTHQEGTVSACIVDETGRPAYVEKTVRIGQARK